MNGYKFMKKLRQIKTKVKVILTAAFEINHGILQGLAIY
jgi:hypothetical protein